jgi:hypothetical protein
MDTSAQLLKIVMFSMHLRETTIKATFQPLFLVNSLNISNQTTLNKPADTQITTSTGCITENRNISRRKGIVRTRPRKITVPPVAHQRAALGAIVDFNTLSFRDNKINRIADWAFHGIFSP